MKRQDCSCLLASHHALGDYQLACENAEAFLFTENESNSERLWGASNANRFVKDGIDNFIVHGRTEAVNPDRSGTKAAAHYHFELTPGESRVIRLRLTQVAPPNTADATEPPRWTPPPRSAKARATEEAEKNRAKERPFMSFDGVFRDRIREADEFYADLAPELLKDEHRAIQRQALAGMLWSKQFYHYIVEQWLEGDPAQPPPPNERKEGRNAGWRHLYNERVMSMPDKWEYPWYASWDLAFHCIPLALVDPHFAKTQLDLIVREWYQHGNGQVPAYEWHFGDVNPPVLAWAAWRVYKMEQRQSGHGDRGFLETVFHKMLIAFTWWVNRKDSSGDNIFEGGFLGLDNIGVFDRSAASARRRNARAERRHELDGNVLAQPPADGAGAGPRKSRLRKYRDEILPAFPRHRQRDEQPGRHRYRTLGRDG